MSEKEITFVTCFSSIYSNDINNTTLKTPEFRFDRFLEIAKTGIQICLYISEDVYYYAEEVARLYPNVLIMSPFIDNEQLEAPFQTVTYSLPHNRNREKDTNLFLLLINSKIGFVNDAIEKNPWNSTHFAWIDFNITHVFHKKKEEALNYLKVMARRTWTTDPFLACPGCSSLTANDERVLLDNVVWRFCGGLFFGDAGSITHFHQLYKTHFIGFVTQHNRLIWEVNFWAWLSCKGWFAPIWYKADHDESMLLSIPPALYSLPLYKSVFYKKQSMETSLENMADSSISYLYHNGQHIINKRFVNYHLLDMGNYIIHHPQQKLVTKNMAYVLSDDFTISGFDDDQYEVVDPDIVTGEHTANYRNLGLEDIRLYPGPQAQIRFIATVASGLNGRNRMVIGDYVMEKGDNNTNPDKNRVLLENTIILDPPTDTWCEKNWIPLKMGEGRGNLQDYFIYKWSPLEIGQHDVLTNRLDIIRSYPVLAPDFHRVRGSTIFITPFRNDSNVALSQNNQLIGVVHFSEEVIPRQYHHMLVTLDKDTLKPIAHSDPFYFQHLGIEFCTGFTIMAETNEYVFWVSKMDRDPVLIRILMDEIPLKYRIN